MMFFFLWIFKYMDVTSMWKMLQNRPAKVINSVGRTLNALTKSPEVGKEHSKRKCPGHDSRQYLMVS